MKIGLFGGAFDPPHLAHQLVTKALLERQVVDEVWYVPVYIHPWAKELEKNFLTVYELRKEMIKLILQKGSRLEEFKDVSFTYSTLEYFADKFPQHEFSWIMGSEYLPKWDRFLAGHPGLVDYQVLVYPRAGFEMKPLYSNMVALEGVEEIKVSSRQVRERVAIGESVKELVKKEVEGFIIKNKLY